MFRIKLPHMFFNIKLNQILVDLIASFIYIITHTIMITEPTNDIYFVNGDILMIWLRIL